MKNGEKKLYATLEDKVNGICLQINQLICHGRESK